MKKMKYRRTEEEGRIEYFINGNKETYIRREGKWASQHGLEPPTSILYRLEEQYRKANPNSGKLEGVILHMKID